MDTNQIIRDKRIKYPLLILIDVVTIFVSNLIACLLAYGYINLFEIAFSKTYLTMFLIDIVLTVGLFSLAKMYTTPAKYIGVKEAMKQGAVACICVAVNVIIALIPRVFAGTTLISARWSVCYGMSFLLISLAWRFGLRLYIREIDHRSQVQGKALRAMIIGAGEGGITLIREMHSSNKINITPICIIDDDKTKLGSTPLGSKVVGTTKDIEAMAKKYNIDIIYLAIPTISAERKKEILLECQKTNCKVMALPGVYQLLSGEALISKAKEVDVQDLLGREQIKVNLDEIADYVAGKVCMVTGGGGSIGSELCRQIAKHNPKQLIIFDIYENNAYDIEQELKRTCPTLNLLALIGSVRDEGKLDKVFATYRPQIVFHAAAHKHVPLMETSPNEAVKNNVLGTLKLARVADKYGVERFVQISTDKAVNPTNIMGATKRICEMIIQTMAKRSKTEFVAVRFGNVLGSNGSVIPLFKKQIAEGGPVTVTHKDIIRYFMTIPEAVSLVLQAGAYAKGGEIFVLDMGEPMKIYDLAVNLIKLSGYVPGKDIEIKVTGLRPGEKLYEERLMAEEGMQTTPNKMISIGKPIDIDGDFLMKKLEELNVSAYSETENMKDIVAEIVPTYKVDKSH